MKLTISLDNRFWSVGAMLILATGLIIWLLPPSTDKPADVIPKKNFNTINDTSVGLSFNVSTDFEPIARDELAAMNPGFTYGFVRVDDKLAKCIVSVSKLKSPGSITATKLRGGLIRAIKKSHPSVKLVNQTESDRLLKFGASPGVLLEVSFKENGNVKNRVEIIALGNKNQVIAYCEGLTKDQARYKDAFTVFFSSFRLDD